MLGKNTSLPSQNSESVRPISEMYLHFWSRSIVFRVFTRTIRPPSRTADSPYLFLTAKQQTFILANRRRHKTVSFRFRLFIRPLPSLNIVPLSKKKKVTAAALWGSKSKTNLMNSTKTSKRNREQS